MTKVFVHSVLIMQIVSSSAVSALPKLMVHPVPIGAETVRYTQGSPTLDLKLPSGAVQISPLEFDHGGLSFSIAVLNTSNEPANFGVENIAVQTDSQPIVVFTKDQLVSKAENRAMWTQIGLAALGGLAAASAANQQRQINTTTRTPDGQLYRTQTTYSDSSDDLRSAATIAGTGVAIGAVQRRLDQTRAALGDQIVQTTTVDPFDSYAGRIVLEKIKKLIIPQDVLITIAWNGQSYPFSFRISKYGSPPPAFIPLTPSRSLQSVPRMSEQTGNRPAIAPAAPTTPVPPSTN